MRKIIGIGETIMDIIFQDNQPTAAVPGGSVFNGVVSLARLGLPVTMLSETGNDRVGRQILDFMTANGIDNRPSGDLYLRAAFKSKQLPDGDQLFLDLIV